MTTVTGELLQWSVDNYGSEPDKSTIIREVVNGWKPLVLSAAIESIYLDLMGGHPLSHAWTLLGLLQPLTTEECNRILDKPFPECDEYLRRLCEACNADLSMALTIQWLLCGHIPENDASRDDVEAVFKRLLQNSDDIDLGVSFLRDTKLPQPCPIITMRHLAESPSALLVYTLLATSDSIHTGSRKCWPAVTMCSQIEPTEVMDWGQNTEPDAGMENEGLAVD